MSEETLETAGYRRFGSGIITQTQKLKERLFPSLRHSTDDRVVYVDNCTLSNDPAEHLPTFPDNTVVSSKYTLITFLPKNLFDQLRRIANFYFLCVAFIQFVIDTPVTPLTSILPLAFVISVTAIKQGYEDWLRHRADSEVNHRPAYIIRNGVQQPDCKAMDIKVGDIVKVLVNEEFPCDLVMLSSQDKNGQCFVTTANLDGETNLKTHYCLPETQLLRTPERLGQLRAKIKCKAPIPNLYSFEGVMEFGLGCESQPLGVDNLLLRGARLKNTDYIYGCAIYTGRDTKMALNSKSKKTKFSRVERKMNAYLLVFLIILTIESVVSTGIKFWYEESHGIPWYVSKESFNNEAQKAVETGLAFMVLYNYIIPISLYVTVEMQKFLGSLFFGWDLEMYDASIDEPAMAITSDLNEELGQIEYLFTDKTGTLTENTMAFRRCCIGARQFEEIGDQFYEKIGDELDLNNAIHYTEMMDDFYRVLVLCHTVRVDHHKGENHVSLNGSPTVYSATGKEYVYQASSPDEKALVEACCKFGVIYHGINNDLMEVTMRDEMKRYKLLHSLPFDPTRKRMSVIIEDVSGKVAKPKGGRTKAGREELAANDNRKIFLLCKGADVAIMDRVVAGDIESTQKMIDLYAELGLRTLSITQRRLSMEEFLYFDKELREAKRTLENREQKLSALYGEIEQSLTLLGATAVEDKLQHEVPQTIEALRLAGIKVWVLTGDKEETAVNISHSAGHFNKEMLELRLTQVHSDEQCEEQLKQLIQSTTLCSPDTEHALIIDGQSLHWAIKRHMDWLLQLCLKCVAVLCCRMSPIQKAEIVAMVKRSKGHPVTAAIGDGANDVSMIQEADVGFGIMGKEGRQAVRNSDYAFGKFRFLRRAILLHGHFYYNRIAVLVQYFFYKNVAWITGQLLYAIFNGWSSQSLYDAFYLVFYNLTFTSLPILIYGLFEQHKSKEVLLNNPSLYRKIARNATLSWDQFLKWNLLGVWHCCVIFFGIYLLQKDGVSMFKSGETIGNYDYGSLIHFSCVTTVNVKLMIETYYWCIATSFAYLITYAGIIVLVAVYTNLFWPSSISSDDLYKAIAQLFSGPVPWLAMILVIILALIPDILIRVCKDIRFTHMKTDRYKEKRKKSFTLVNRQAQVVSTSNGQRQKEVDKPLHKVTESIELKDRPNGTTKHSRLHGYVNTAMTLSSEDIPSATLTNSERGPPNSSHSTTSSPGANGVPSRKLSTDSCDNSIIATHFTTKASFARSSPSHIVHTVDLHLQDPLSHVNSKHPSNKDTPNPVVSQTALVVDIHTDDVGKSSDNNDESTPGSTPNNTSSNATHAQHDNNIPVPVDEVTYSNSPGHGGVPDTGTLPPHYVTTIQVKGDHVDQQATAATAMVDSFLPHDIKDGLSLKAPPPNTNDALSLNASSLHDINDVQSLNATNSHDTPSSVHSSPSRDVVVNLEPLQHPEPINEGSDSIREFTKL